MLTQERDPPPHTQNATRHLVLRFFFFWFETVPYLTAHSIFGLRVGFGFLFCFLMTDPEVERKSVRKKERKIIKKNGPPMRRQRRTFRRLMDHISYSFRVAEGFFD